VKGAGAAAIKVTLAVRIAATAESIPRSGSIRIDKNWH
jgi:hypothetical protein